VLPPLEKKTPRKVVHLDGMECPNHNCSFDLEKIPGTQKPNSQRFPMMRMMWAEKGAGQAERLLFVDEVYEMRHWTDRDEDCAPSWMDPEIFIRMALKDERVRQIYEKYKENPTDARKRQLMGVLQEVFEAEYLVYMFEQFELAKPLLADWVIGHHATKDLDAEIRGTRKKRVRRKKQPE
jgi:hypothetical protein